MRIILCLIALLISGDALAQATPPVTGGEPCVGATASAPGVKGVVPAPQSADLLGGRVLSPACIWVTPFQIQAPKNGSYTVVANDANYIIPFNCSSPCTVTMPISSTTVLPIGVVVELKNISSPAVPVTIASAGPVIYGVPKPSGSVVLASTGDYVDLQTDNSFNYLASGVFYGGTTTGAITNISCDLNLTTSCGTVLVSQGF